MERHLAEHLRRLGQADRILRDHGDSPEPFLLIYAMGGSVGIKHPAWDPSWAVMTAEAVDDLAELGFVRTEPDTNVKRLFSLTVKGRQQAAVLAETSRTYTGGRAPALDQALEWLIEQAELAPERFDLPTRLVDQAVSSGVVSETDRDALAARILALREQDYLSGFIPELDQATAEQRLGRSDGLSLTMKALDHAKAKGGNGGNTVNFNGSVIAGQIAAGDITNYVSFGDLLDRAAAEIAALEDVTEDARADALGLIEVLRGKATTASGQVLTGAGGALLATVLGQLLGLSPGF